jgi:hypothetical protein
MKEHIFVKNSRRALAAALVVLLSAGCITFVPATGVPATGSKPANKNAIQGWVTSEQALVATVVPPDPDGNLKVRVQYDLTKIPVLTWEERDVMYIYHDSARQPKKEMMDVPVGDKIAIQRQPFGALVEEPGYIKFDKAELVENFHNQPSDTARDFSEVVSVNPDEKYWQGDQKWPVRWQLHDIYKYDGDVKLNSAPIKSGTIDIADYLAMWYAESEKRAKEIETMIAALDDKYPLTRAGLDDYERAVRSMDSTQTLEPERTVIEKAINARRISVNTALEAEKKILTTPNEFAQLGSYTFSSPASTVHVLILPEGNAEIAVLYANAPDRQFSGGWRRTDNGFIVQSFSMQSPFVFVKTGNTYKVTERGVANDKVAFSRTVSTVQTGGAMYTSIQATSTGYKAFIFEDANTAQIYNISGGGADIVNLGKGTYTIKDNIVLINAGGMTLRCRIVGSRFLAWELPFGGYHVLYH